MHKKQSDDSGYAEKSAAGQGYIVDRYADSRYVGKKIDRKKCACA